MGDNLEIYREIDDERLHLICTDPPLNSGRDHNAFIGDSLAEKKVFTAYLKHGGSDQPRNQNTASTTNRCNSYTDNGQSVLVEGGKHPSKNTPIPDC